MTPGTVTVAPLSIWDLVHLGTGELGRRVQVTLAERNMLIGGEPGGGKSVALQLIVAHGAAANSTVIRMKNAQCPGKKTSAMSTLIAGPSSPPWRA